MRVIFFAAVLLLLMHYATGLGNPAPAPLECPPETRITIIEGTKKTCLVEHINKYSHPPGIYVPAHRP
jgi:hypothetical protein